MYDRYRILLTITCLLGLLVSAASATENVFQPGPETGRDSWVRDNDPASVNGNQPYLYFGGYSGNEMRLYIRFDVSALPPGTNVTAAEMQFYMFSQSGLVDIYTYGVYPVTGSWSESSLTWSNQPAFATEPLVTFSGESWQEGWLQWHAITGLASLVQQWVDDPASNHGVVIKPVETFYGYVSVWSSEHTDANLRPKLVVQSDYVGAEGRTWGGVKALYLCP